MQQRLKFTYFCPMYVLPPGRYTLLDGLHDMMNIVRKLQRANEIIVTHSSTSDDNQQPPVPPPPFVSVMSFPSNSMIADRCASLIHRFLCLFR
jgi:hypothetical protein